MPKTLGDRINFSSQVFIRDSGKCVICGEPGIDAHHIIERRLWPDGGYYLDNGVSLCSECHLKAEMTLITVEQLREAAGITKILVPPHLYPDDIIDKWGNHILPNGRRLKGELFYDKSVLKILREGNVLDQFTDWVKYPRTHHLPWSLGAQSDDRYMDPKIKLELEPDIVVTEKFDGECTTMYTDYIHARSLDSQNHPSRNWVKNFHAKICHDIPPGWRICGENLFAKHSIGYHNLPSYFIGFSIWNRENICLSWDDTVEWFKLLDIVPATVLYRGSYQEFADWGMMKMLDTAKQEGYVLRTARTIPFKDFRHLVGKWVRPGHVQTVKHWMHGQPMEKNRLGVTTETPQAPDQCH